MSLFTFQVHCVTGDNTILFLFANPKAPQDTRGLNIPHQQLTRLSVGIPEYTTFADSFVPPINTMCKTPTMLFGARNLVYLHLTGLLSPSTPAPVLLPQPKVLEIHGREERGIRGVFPFWKVHAGSAGVSRRLHRVFKFRDCLCREGEKTNRRQGSLTADAIRSSPTYPRSLTSLRCKSSPRLGALCERSGARQGGEGQGGGVVRSRQGALCLARTSRAVPGAARYG